MAVLKCKMCGGDLKVSEETRIAECEYCGSTQTVPDGNDEKKANLFNRANRLRMDNEFDKAAGVYESIVSEFPEEAEGYWGLVLCSYGIEYVDDATTGKKIPTCHRTLASSIMDDDNFAQACENADTLAKSIYREEAKAIDKLQKEIMTVVENEEPYDVFICYKETDDATKARTEDSLIAQDIYTELIKEGYKVFFSRVTLRDKAGSQYEPYIYAALSSAKVMLAISTKFEYYDAVWVKNEWSRYIAMMGADNTKHLIPCFKNLDAYDIPKEFKNLQALDMGEVTFFKSLADNVERFIAKENSTVETVVVSNVDTNTTPLLKRAFMFLEDGDFKSADEYCEKVLDIDPECAEAYLGKLMAELRVRAKDAIHESDVQFDNNSNYAKILRFGDEALRTELEQERCESVYLNAKRLLNSAQSENEFQDIAKRFEAISGYKDANEIYKQCIELAEECPKKNETLSSGRKCMNSATEEGYEEAINIFRTIPGWKNADSLIIECEKILEHIHKRKAEEKRLLIEAEELREKRRLEAEKLREKRRLEDEKHKAEEAEKARIAEEKRKEEAIILEQKRREEKAKRKAEAEQRKEKLLSEKTSLEAEFKTLGFMAFMRKKEINMRLVELDQMLKDLERYN